MRPDYPIVIESNRMEAPTRGLVIFTGAVVAKLDNATQLADRMEVYLDEKGERALRIVSIGNVKVTTVGGRKGTAQRAEYSDGDQWLLLLGDARVWDGENVVAGEKIAMFLTANPVLRPLVDRYVALGGERLARDLLTGVCSIKGQVQNQTSEPLYVRIWWRGYDDADIFVGTAFAEVYLPAGDREAFESRPFYLGRPVLCHHIMRYERDEVKVYLSP